MAAAARPDRLALTPLSAPQLPSCPVVTEELAQLRGALGGVSVPACGPGLAPGSALATPTCLGCDAVLGVALARWLSPSRGPRYGEVSPAGAAGGVPLRALHAVRAECVTCSLLLKNTTEFEAKGTYFLIIFLLVSSNTVVKETKASEKLFSLPVEEGPCAALLPSVDAGPALRSRGCFFQKGPLPSLLTNGTVLTFEQEMGDCCGCFLF